MSKDELQQIADFIASLPSNALLDRCQTEAQKTEWHNYRKNQLLIAAGWEAEFIRCEGDPIGHALEQQEISKHRHDLLQQRVQLGKYQWELIKVAHPYVAQWHNKIYDIIGKFAKRLLPPQQYPFQTAFDLFSETLREEVNGSFSWCLEPYYEVPVKKWREATEQLKDNIEQADTKGNYPEIKPTEADKLKNKLVWNKLGFSWWGVTLLVCQIVSIRDPLLRQKLINYNHAFTEYCKIGIRAARKVPGFAWKNGEQIPASKAGGVYHNPKPKSS